MFKEAAPVKLRVNLNDVNLANLEAVDKLVKAQAAKQVGDKGKLLDAAKQAIADAQKTTGLDKQEL